jgi:CRP-like cAMP-binding protein
MVHISERLKERLKVMYEKIFDQNTQIDMDRFFIENFANEGIIKWFEKGVIINPPDNNHIYLVLEGELNQVMFSKNGSMINYYRLLRGNIFGEIDYFDGSRSYVVNKTMKSCKIAVIGRKVLEEKFKKNPDIYSYFLTSIVKKYRIVMLELANHKFNDSLGRLADFFIRLYYAEENPSCEETMDILFTHEDIANRVGLNRVTVTRGIKKFVELELIEFVDRKILIKDIKGLEKFTNIPI